MQALVVSLWQQSPLQHTVILCSQGNYTAKNTAGHRPPLKLLSHLLAFFLPICVVWPTATSCLLSETQQIDWMRFAALICLPLTEVRKSIVGSQVVLLFLLCTFSFRTQPTIILLPVQGTCMDLHHQPLLDKSFFRPANKEKIQSTSPHSLQMSSRKRRKAEMLCGSWVWYVLVVWHPVSGLMLLSRYLGGAGWLPKGVAYKCICSGLWDAWIKLNRKQIAIQPLYQMM